MNRFNGPAAAASRVVSLGEHRVPIFGAMPPACTPVTHGAHPHSRMEDLNLPLNTYEGMFLLDSAKAATAWEDTVKHVHDILIKHIPRSWPVSPVG